MRRKRLLYQDRRAPSPRPQPSPTSTERRTRRSRRSRGQAIAEFTLILPLMLVLFGAGVDFARVFYAWVNLQASTRVAAEYVATDPMGSSTTPVITSANAADQAKQLVCRQITGNPICSTVTVLAPSFTSCSASSCVSPLGASLMGGTPDNPVVQVKISSTMQFKTVIPWWFITNNGTFNLGATETYMIIRYRQ